MSAAKNPIPTTAQLKPFKPRRGLFALFAVLNLIWIGALVTMYFTTVRDTPESIYGEPRATSAASLRCSVGSG
jgi:hypothetical protein